MGFFSKATEPQALFLPATGYSGFLKQAPDIFHGFPALGNEISVSRPRQKFAERKFADFPCVLPALWQDVFNASDCGTSLFSGFPEGIGLLHGYCELILQRFFRPIL
jgi:hypothetical protein